MNKEILKKAFENSNSFNDYYKITVENHNSVNPDTLDDTGKERYEITKLNIHRMERILKTYNPGKEIVDSVNKVTEPQRWLFLTEEWCGDSAQTLPYISKIISLNENIKIGFLERDENPEIMDMYLTNGSRSIPKLIAFDENFNELFQWGPRPKEGQELVARLKAEGFSKQEFNEKLHLWYGRNRGKAIENDFIRIFSGL